MMPPAVDHRLELNGMQFHVVAQGDHGPLVVLCHGFPGLWYSWRHQLAALAAAGYRAVALDQRGIGGTDRPTGENAYDHDHTTADLLALAEAFGEDRAVYVGHDFGGPQVWELACRRPERVRGIAVLSTPYEPGVTERPPSETNAAIAREHFLHRHYFQTVGPADRELDANVALFLRRLFHALSAQGDYLHVWRQPPDTRGYIDALPPFDGGFDWLTEDDFQYYVDAYSRTGFTGGLGWYRAADRNWELKRRRADFTIRVPSLFLAGTEDAVPAMARPGVIERMAAHMPDLAVERVPGAGHWVQQEQPARVNDALLRFLARLDRDEPRSD